MINLLPPEEKSRLKWAQRKKVIIINWSLILLFLFFTIAGIFLVDMYIGQQINGNKDRIAEVEKNYQGVSLNNFQKEVGKFNGGLEKVKSYYNQRKYVSDVIESVSSIIGASGIYVKNFSYSLTFIDKVPDYRIVISGHAPSREVLFNFKKDLEKNPNFSEIIFPQENWVKAIDVDFEINMKIK